MSYPFCFCPMLHFYNLHVYFWCHGTFTEKLWSMLSIASENTTLAIEQRVDCHVLYHFYFYGYFISLNLVCSKAIVVEHPMKIEHVTL